MGGARFHFFFEIKKLAFFSEKVLNAESKDIKISIIIE